MKVSDSDVLAWVRGQNEMSQALARLGCWISPCYGSFSISAGFVTYEPFISLNFKFVSGRGKPRIIENADAESATTGLVI
jgi:hypothetical protein